MTELHNEPILPLLEYMIELCPTEAQWSQLHCFADALDEDATAQEATRFDLYGLVVRASIDILATLDIDLDALDSDSPAKRTIRALGETLGVGCGLALLDWQDAPERTHKEILALLHLTKAIVEKHENEFGVYR